LQSIMSTLTRRFYFVPAVLVAALAAGYALLWAFAAHRMEEGFRNWTQVQATHGHSIEHGPLSVSGFPGPIKLTIDAPRYAGAKTGWQWSAERADLEMRPWDWWTYRLDVFGTHRFAVPDGAGQLLLTARPATAFVVAEIDGRGRVSRAALHADGLQLNDAEGTELLAAAQMRGTAQMSGADVAAHDRTSLDLTLQATDVTLGPPIQSPLGARLAEVGLAAAVRGALPETLQRDAVDAWRQDGGTVDLTHLYLTWGALELRANGTVTLDERLRPLGALSAEIKGYGETLTALEQARILPRRAAAGSRIALDLLSRSDGNARRVVTVPISAQNGALFLGPVRMVRLEPIPFPAR
jgi:hypothetical protein